MDREFGIVSLGPWAKIVIVGLLVSCIAWLLWPRPEDLRSGLTRAFECLERADSRCLSGYLSEEETQAGVDVEKLEQFLSKIYLPAIQGLRTSEGPFLRLSATGQTGEKNKVVLDDEGRFCRIGLVMAQSQDGPRLHGLMEQLIRQVGVCRIQPTDEGYPVSVEKGKALGKELMAFVPVMEEIGLGSIQAHAGWGPGRTVLVREYAQAMAAGRRPEL